MRESVSDIAFLLGVLAFVVFAVIVWWPASILVLGVACIAVAVVRRERQ